MGYETSRFSKGVSSQFICSICKNVFHDPVKLVGCDHIFCRTCILPVSQSLDKNRRICPLDRNKIKKGGTEDPPRVFVELWKELEIACNYANQGCTEKVPIENLDSHTKKCQFNISTCHGNCGFRGPVSGSHNCVDYLKQLNSLHENTIDQMKRTIDGLNEIIEELETRLSKLSPTDPSAKKTMFGRFRSSLRNFNCSRGVLIDEINK